MIIIEDRQADSSNISSSECVNAMTQFDFSPLYEKYPVIIAQMPNVFTSHEFILHFAHENQQQYIDALSAYRDATHRGEPAPFMVVHGILAKGLRKFPEIVGYIGETLSIDIFGQSNECSRWRRV